MSTSDLQALFANLRPKPRDSPAPSYTSNSPASLSALSPPPAGPPPFTSSTNDFQHGQHQMAQPTAAAPSATAQSLLNLLNFGPSSSTDPTSRPVFSSSNLPTTIDRHNSKPPMIQSTSQGPTTSATELLTKLMSLPPEEQSTTQPPSNLEDQGGGGENPPPLNGRDPSQDALLKLLSKTHRGNSASARPDLEGGSQSQDELDNKSLSASITTPRPTSAHISLAGSKPSEPAQPLFTYTNPFEALHTPKSDSRSHTPGHGMQEPQLLHPDVPQQSVETKIEDVEDSISRVGTAEQLAKRKFLTPRLPSGSKRDSKSREASVESTSSTHEAHLEEAMSDHEVTASSPPYTALPGKDKPHSGYANIYESQHHETVETEKPIDHQVDGGDEWEDTEDSPNKESTRIVPVYNFPIKPFVSIQLRLPEPAEAVIRDDGVMEISRLKKDFDQLDRTLAAATSKYIIYALVKNGGMRVIRQDDGSDRQLFKSSGDRIFNVTLCTTSITGEPSDDQSVVGTGISGAVYYATIGWDGNDLFEKNDLESGSLIFPPYPPADENMAGGVLKTRAKRSSRHPEFFAIGRGKAIHLVWPATALSSRYGVEGRNRRVDADKFFQERSLQIVTGKAGKDFTFSEDDTLIVSLDKTGKLRFWDIRKLIDESNSTSSRLTNVAVDSPLLSLSTALPSEKSWPTSVTFVDKIRPYTKGSALRYVLVGLRQNHTLQLWDIALGKAVQEVNFPHESETDGICSVCYHPNSGIIVVGHPTRNSIFFIHLSAPRYTLATSMSQAAYVQRIAQNDPDLPEPDSTACMSGIREISFAARGQLRSLEILPLHRTAEEQVEARKALFELYVVHSKGVTCININKEDLGWDEGSKVVYGINAVDQGYVSLKELRLGSMVEEGPQESSPAEETQPTLKSSRKKSSKKSSTSRERTENVQVESAEPAKAAPNELLSNGARMPQEPSTVEAKSAKESKKGKKKVAAAQTLEQQDLRPGAAATGSSNKIAVDSNAAATAAGGEAVETTASIPAASAFIAEGTSKPDAVSVGISGDWLDKELKKVEKAVATEFRKELSALHQNIQNDRVVQDSAAVARQEALLRLVSTTLSNNVEKAMSRILSAEINQSMIPALTSATVHAVTLQVGEAVTKSLHSVLPHEIRTQLPAAITMTLQSPSMVRTISETISSKLAKHLETQLSTILEGQIVPAFKTLAIATAEKAASEIEVGLRNEIRQLENDRRNDMSRLEKLAEVLQATAATLQQMCDTQVAFQGQILKDRRQLALLEENSPAIGSRQVSTARLTPSPRAVNRQSMGRQPTKEEREFEEISHMMNDGRYEEASIKWLQSAQPSDLFDKLFIHFTPEYLATDVSPLIAFSIAVTIGNTLNTNTAQRLEWISAAFHSVDLAVRPLSPSNKKY